MNCLKCLMLVKDYNAKIKDIEDKIPSATGLATTINANINKVKSKIPNMTNFFATDAATAARNTIPNVSDLVKKADYVAERKDVKEECFTASDYNKFTNNILNVKVTVKKLLSESGSNEMVKTLAIKEEIKALAINAELEEEQD